MVRLVASASALQTKDPGKRRSRRRLDVCDAQAEAAKRGGQCLSKRYVTCMQHLRWQCRDGHEWSATLNSILHHGSWCPRCARTTLSIDDAREVAAKRGGQCLSTRYVNCMQHLRWQCREGHEWSATLSSVLHHGSWCPQCRSWASEAHSRRTLESLIGVAFRKSRPHFLQGLELDGYNEELGLAFEYHGAQHFRWVPYFQQTLDEFKQQQRRDMRKRLLCKLHGVCLIEITYKAQNIPGWIARLVRLLWEKSKDPCCGHVIVGHHCIAIGARVLKEIPSF